MSYQLNDKIKNLTPYDPIEGEYEIRLDANESFLSLPVDLLEKASLAALSGQSNRYPDPRAERLCRAFGELYGIRADCLTAGNGSDELISLITGAFFLPGEELITLGFDFSMYRFYGEVFGAKTSVFPKNEDLTVDVDGLIEYAARVKARGIIFSNPCNPTSLCLDRKKVKRIVESLPGCLVVVDEAYMDFANESVLDYINDYENLIVLKTCSKAIGLAAIRLGFAAANPTLTRALRSVKSPYNVNTLTQNVGYMVLTDGDYIVDGIAKIIHSRDKLYSGIMSIFARHSCIEQVYPTSTNFVFLKSGQARVIYQKLLERSIAVRCFDGYLRITAGNKKENAALLHALESIADELEV